MGGDQEHDPGTLFCAQQKLESDIWRVLHRIDELRNFTPQDIFVKSAAVVTFLVVFFINLHRLRRSYFL